MVIEKEWLHSKFQSLVDVIGHLYDKHADDDEEAAKRYLNEKLNIRRRHGYHLQSSGVKIYKWEN